MTQLRERQETQGIKTLHLALYIAKAPGVKLNPFCNQQKSEKHSFIYETKDVAETVFASYNNKFLNKSCFAIKNHSETINCTYGVPKKERSSKINLEILCK